MKNTRGLWASIIFVVALTAIATAGLITGALRPTLGLDLQGGVAVILTAPDDTPPDVMEQALENIRRRVDAFGVGEPDIFLSGTTIEVQIPGAADSAVEERPADLYCVIGADDANHGCAEEEADAEAAVEGLEVTSRATEVCVVTDDGETVDCFGSAAEARTAIAGYTVAPEAAPTPTPSASGSGSPSPSPSVSEGPQPPADAYCLTDPAGNQPVCVDTQAEAQTILNNLGTEVNERTWCVTPTQPEPEPEPTPSGSASATPTPTSSPSVSGVEAFSRLDSEGAEALPCDFGSREEAQAALEEIGVTNVTTRFCVISSAEENLGCYISRETAVERQQETGQQRLLDVIGTTARLEERPTIAIVTPGDPTYGTLSVTCGTAEEQATRECTGNALDDEEVVYLDADGNKVQLGPVILDGANVERATAVLSGGTAQDPLVQWRVTFDFDSEGAEAFAEATTRAYVAPPPQNQIAIVVDRVIVSNPVVQEPITGGTGEITGSFTEQEAKDLATLLNAGSLPVELTRQSVRNVSPTLGEESLQQGIVAGLAGLALLFLYLLFYYRLLGVVAWFGMTIWAILAVALVSIAGTELGYALSLAGVAGLVISLGVTADSYIVFFERLKDELHSGKSARTVVQPAFKRAFRTIVAADFVTGIAAIVLYVTAVSSVRGFALTLLVATFLDLFVVYYFKRPTVFLLARNSRLANLRGFGLTSATASDHALDEGRPR
ncbi:MAG TPA: protein translocase subunit SecD [Actinomycetota bacterium]